MNDYIFELKSDTAIEKATGPNEIIRQFQRHKNYFYEDGRHDLPRGRGRGNSFASFLLVFAPTETCIRHVDKYLASYASVQGRESRDGVEFSTAVMFFEGGDAWNTLPVTAFKSAVPEGKDWKAWFGDAGGTQFERICARLTEE